jgi:hypothetical protein
MIVRQTLDLPADHRLTIQVPWEITSARIILTMAPEPAKEPDIASQYNNLANSVEEALHIAEERAKDPNIKPISAYFGTLSPDVYGDGVAYQRVLRDEWDD